MEESGRLKTEGTTHFQHSRWSEALHYYELALRKLPLREVKDNTNTESQQHNPQVTESGTCAKARAILNGNISACYFRLNDFAGASKACTVALLDNPGYSKVLRRRAECEIKIGTWSSLTQAQSDLKRLLDILSTNDPMRDDISRQLDKVTPLLAKAQKAETDEMLGKLKELGNNVLGNFGLSTDNFKFEPNGQGGYSMQFCQ